MDNLYNFNKKRTLNKMLESIKYIEDNLFHLHAADHIEIQTLSTLKAKVERCKRGNNY